MASKAELLKQYVGKEALITKALMSEEYHVLIYSSDSPVRKSRDWDWYIIEDVGQDIVIARDHTGQKEFFSIDHISKIEVFETRKDDVTFCVVDGCTGKSTFHCSGCGRNLCEYHASEQEIPEVFARDFDSLAYLFSMCERLRVTQMEGEYDFRYNTPSRTIETHLSSTVGGTYRLFYEKCFPIMGPLQLGGGRLCEQCSLNHIKRMIQKVKNYLESQPLKELKSKGFICSDDFCFLDVQQVDYYRCTSCGRHFCYNHIEECWQCKKKLCCYYHGSRSRRDETTYTFVVGGCAADHKHLFKSPPWVTIVSGKSEDF